MTTTEIRDTQIIPGSANQVLSVNTAGTADEYRTLSGTTNEINVAFATGSITLSTPQAIATTSSPTFSSLTLTNPLTVANGGTGSTSFTSGSVIFSNGSILTQNNSKLFWDNTNFRLGIGTASPTTSLHVTGTAGTDAIYTPGDIEGNNLIADGNVNIENHNVLNLTDTHGASVSLQAPTTLSGGYTLRFPTAQGASNSIFVNDGSGNLSFSTTPTFTALTVTGSITATNQTITVQNIVITGVTSDPASPVAGQFWYRSDTAQWVGYNGSNNVILG
jgi:hypothetical protein